MSTPHTIVIPGQDLGLAANNIAGPGTHIYSSHLYASISGPVVRSNPNKPVGPVKRLNKITAQGPAPLPTVSIHRLFALDHTSTGGGRPQEDKKQAIPEVGSTVLCKVTRIAQRQATVSILVVGETVLDGEWQGLIRVQDVRATEKDRVKIFESFRPGDIVRAAVISLGDQANYYLSTASNHLGVIMATSEAGNTMYPVSWKEFRDPETDLSESRKVAKPV